jgi:hypothetical protein
MYLKDLLTHIDQHSSVRRLNFAWLEDDIAIQATLRNLVQGWILETNECDSASMY